MAQQQERQEPETTGEEIPFIHPDFRIEPGWAGFGWISACMYKYRNPSPHNDGTGVMCEMQLEFGMHPKQMRVFAAGWMQYLKEWKAEQEKMQ